MIDASLIKPKYSQNTNSNVNSESMSTRKEPAFNKIYRLVGVYKEPQIKIHPILHKIFSSELIFESNRLPMVIPPIPWHMPTQGGYILTKSDLLRLRSDMSEQRILIDKAHPSSMYSVFDSLNILSTCPWKINTRVLDILIDLFINGGNRELDVPELKEAQFPKLPNKTKEMLTNKEEFKRYISEKNTAQKVCSEMHSLWCTELYRLSIANMYRDKIFWFPHSLDFRGRVRKKTLFSFFF
jgi:DNA-directed RNA polymerase, mitochondrial